jgi:hypothetical protein
VHDLRLADEVVRIDTVTSLPDRFADGGVGGAREDHRDTCAFPDRMLQPGIGEEQDAHLGGPNHDAEEDGNRERELDRGGAAFVPEQGVTLLH